VTGSIVRAAALEGPSIAKAAEYAAAAAKAAGSHKPPAKAATAPAPAPAAAEVRIICSVQLVKHFVSSLDLILASSTLETWCVSMCIHRTTANHQVLKCAVSQKMQFWLTSLM
jgi:hypothetical protein